MGIEEYKNAWSDGFEACKALLGPRDVPSVGDQLRAIRKTLHLTQAEAAKLAQMQPMQMYRLENCDNFTITTLTRVADALGVRVQIKLIACADVVEPSDD